MNVKINKVNFITLLDNLVSKLDCDDCPVATRKCSGVFVTCSENIYADLKERGVLEEE